MLFGCTNIFISEDNPSEIWRLEGKMSVRSPRFNGSATIDWTYGKDYFKFLVSSPFGLPLAKLEGNRDLIDITLPPERTQTTTFENLHHHIGYRLPLKHLTFWVRGIPNPDYTFVGHDSNFDQDGWSVSFLKYEERLPRKIRLERDNITITLIIKSWLV